LYVGKVIGKVVATRKDDRLVGIKLLLVQPLNPRREVEGEGQVVVDSVGAGVGETVLVITGSAVRQAHGAQDAPIDATIVGIRGEPGVVGDTGRKR